MKITYSEAADALYIQLARMPGRPLTKKIAPGLFLDFDPTGKRVLGLEVLDASTRYPKAELRAFGSPVEWMTLAEAEADAARDGDTIRAVTIRGLLLNGQLEGRKIGKTWQVARHALATYLTNRPKPGPAPRRRSPHAKDIAHHVKPAVGRRRKVAR